MLTVEQAERACAEVGTYNDKVLRRLLGVCLIDLVLNGEKSTDPVFTRLRTLLRDEIRRRGRAFGEHGL